MKFRLLLPGLLALVFMTAACLPPPNLRNEKFLSDNSLITNEPCEAPCWRGITPGETSWSDALTILEDDTSLNDPEVQTAEEGTAVGAQWSGVDGEACCQIISEDGEIVSVVLLQLAPTTTLGELFEARGEPTYAIGTPVTDDQAIVSLFYPENALIVIAFAAGAATGEVSEASEVVGSYYLTPDRMDLIIKTSSLYAWDGYQAFSAYAADAEDGNFAVTPSVTLTPTVEGQ